MLIYITTIAALIADLVSKHIVILSLTHDKEIIWSFFMLKLAKNIWISFSLPLTWIILKMITVIIIGAIITYYFKNERLKENRLLDFGYWLLIWWAIWNWYERLVYWAVTDFLSLKFFAIFNFGDIFVCVWALIILYYYHLENARTRKGN